MAVFKCKMCGGDLNIDADINVVECEYCGTTQTVPTADNEKKMSLFARANKLRAACDFDKAAGVYESIVTEFPEEAEGYWGLILCKYGIEYVDDPATGKKVPTCHRSSFDCILDDSDFEMVMENADSVARKVYRDEAKAIEELRKSIIEISGKEEPYDIFICYKETAENGDRTIDSVIAQDVYDELTAKGYRVFFSRITLEDKLGQEYEPYIFAALNSAKVMLAFGTDYEYYNAVWVKNEWSRFLQLISKGEKKTLIPCYKNIDAYDMPKEFAKLQAQDMGKVGAVQDLLRGIEKIIPKNDSAQVKETVVVSQSAGPNVEALLKRGNNALEDGNFSEAKTHFDKVLDIDAECAEAYLGLAMADKNVCNLKDLVSSVNFENKNYIRAKQYGDKTFLDKIAPLEKVAEEERIKYEKAIEELQIKLAVIRKKTSKVANIVATGLWHTVGLKSDGTVFVNGYDVVEQCKYEQCKIKIIYNYSQWADIVAVATGLLHTVGLKSDGTVVAAGANFEGRCNVSKWENIAAVAAGSSHSVGLKSDGTVVAVGDDKSGQCNVSDWENIVAVAAGWYHTVGLKSDGTVIAAGKNEEGQCNISQWENIVAIAAGENHTVGLKSDGTVVAVGDKGFGQCEVSDWKNIVAIAAGCVRTMGLMADGKVVAVGENKHGQCNILFWKLFDSFDNFEEERRKKTEEKTAELKRIANQKAKYRSNGVCQYCGGKFKGLLTLKCANCGRHKDYI